jgi:spore germination protein YaaH
MQRTNLILALFTAIAAAIIFLSLFTMYHPGRKEPGEEVPYNVDEYFKTIPLERLLVKFFGWVTPDEESINTFLGNADKFTWISPTGSIIDASGNLVPKVDNRIIKAARNSNVSIIPLVANYGFDRNLAHKILTDPDVRERTLTSITDFVIINDFSGVNIDYENIPPEDREFLNSYMVELAARLHSHGKIVTIDVSGKTWDDPYGWGGAWDYRMLGQVCDYICIMCYDYHWSGSEAGPIGPLGWLREVVQYAVSVIPREKIVIGIPFYGYKWLGKKGTGLTFKQALETAKNTGAVVLFSEEDGEYYYSYDSYQVWFQGAKSVELKISAALSYGIDKIAAWRIGQEDPRTWEVISRKP